MAKVNFTLNTSGVQGKTEVQDSSVATKYSCSKCVITYYAATKKPQCPMCQLRTQVDSLRKSLNQVSRQYEAASNLNQRLQAQVDLSVAIREATDLLDDNDTLFFKTILYQWKVDRGITLKLTHEGALDTGAQRNSRDLAPNGFIVIIRGQDPQAHLCTSMGGIAIAEYFEDALHTVGSAAAMNLLLRGFAKLLPGATS